MTLQVDPRGLVHFSLLAVQVFDSKYNTKAIGMVELNRMPFSERNQRFNLIPFNNLIWGTRNQIDLTCQIKSTTQTPSKEMSIS